MAGRIQFFVSPFCPRWTLVKSGRLLAVGVTTRERLALLPDVPTIAEAAVPGFEYDGWYGLVAPARTPRTIINALSREVGRILRLPDVRERIASQGATARPTTPEEFDPPRARRYRRAGKVFKAAGAKAE
jgi:tripartite-type tricarboxylate transporter receptor subunit TctC